MFLFQICIDFHPNTIQSGSSTDHHVAQQPDRDIVKAKQLNNAKPKFTPPDSAYDAEITLHCKHQRVGNVEKYLPQFTVD